MPPILTGLIPACHTPFHRDGRLNLSVVERQAALYRERACAGFSSRARPESSRRSPWTSARPCANAGSTPPETRSGWPCTSGHNCSGRGDRAGGARAATGAAAIAAMAPSFFKPATVEELIKFCLPIAAEAEPLPFYYYHIPSMSGVRLPMAEFLHEARFRIPNLRGLKFSHDDLVDLQGCMAADNGAFEVLFGFDETLLAGVCLGVRGAVGCTYNFAAGHYQRMIRAFDTGDIAAARALQRQAAEMIKVLYEYGFMAAAKAVMGLIESTAGPSGRRSAT